MRDKTVNELAGFFNVTDTAGIEEYGDWYDSRRENGNSNKFNDTKTGCIKTESVKQGGEGEAFDTVRDKDYV
jgi:hypothetical protein